MTLLQSGMKRALALALTTCSLAVSAATSVPNPPWPPVPPPPTNACGYCYNVDIKNNTWWAANDLHVTLQGPTQICQWYTGSWNPFGAPTNVSFTAPNTFQVDFASSTNFVNRGAIAHIGFCSNSPVAGMVSGDYNALPPFYWTRDGKRIGRVLPVSHSWEVAQVDMGTVAVLSFLNPTPEPIRVRQVDFALVDRAIPLNDLMWDGLAGALEWQPLQRDAFIPAGSNDAPGLLRSELPLVIKAGDPRLVVFRVWAEDAADPSNLNRAVGQAPLSSLAAQR
jgi:hypothetical protein